MIRTVYVLERRRRRPGRLRWGPWRFVEVTMSKRGRLLNVAIPSGRALGFEFQTRLVPFDRRRRS